MPGDLKQLNNSVDPDWGELEDLLAAFARLANSDVPFDRVAGELVDHLIHTLGAVGAALWLADSSESLTLQRQVNIGVLGDDVHIGPHRQLLVESLRSGHAEVLAPCHAGAAANPTEFTLILVPVVTGGEAAGMVEVIQRPTIGAEALEGNLRFAAILAELVANHLRRRELRELRQLDQRTRQFEELLHSLHRTLDPRVTASEIANGGRCYIACDRISVAVRRGRRFRLIAVSSVDVIHRRSVAVKRLERLIACVAATGEALCYDGHGQTFAPQIEDALTRYIDESHARFISVVPLRSPKQDEDSRDGAIIGAMVVENFNARELDSVQETTRAVAKHAAVALTNALRHRWLPPLPFVGARHRVTGEPTRRVVQTVAGVGLAAAVASTFLVPIDFHVYAEGELQPSIRNHVYAPLDGQVSIVSVQHGDGVSAGQSLVELSSPELDMEIQKIQGEHEATLQRSLSIESALLDYGSSIDPDDMQVNQFAAEQEELRGLFASQKERLDLLRLERKKLVVRSPIEGEILTWETDEHLRNRPVRRGQRLMTVADLEGPWEAELRVPDGRVGPLLSLFEASDHSLAAIFELATSRGVEYPGEVTRLARRTEVDADNRPVVRVTLHVDKSSLMDPRPGATVYAKIHCGRRSVFYVWCHDLVDSVRSWLYF